MWILIQNDFIHKKPAFTPRIGVPCRILELTFYLDLHKPGCGWRDVDIKKSKLSLGVYAFGFYFFAFNQLKILAIIGNPNVESGWIKNPLVWGGKCSDRYCGNRCPLFQAQGSRQMASFKS